MDNEFTVFDVETPNSHNDRICSIGIAIIQNSTIKDCYNILINPECDFSPYNTRIHGIGKSNVLDAPTFPAVWEQIGHLFHDDIIIAHNAHFDISVLQKTLAAYSIAIPDIQYIDTLREARRVYPFLHNHKLDTLCNELGIQLDHHNSGSDSRATAELFLDMAHKNLFDSDIIQISPAARFSDVTNFGATRSKLSTESSALLELQKILAAIIEDGKIDDGELLVLTSWIASHSYLAGNFPYDTIYNQVVSIVDDGIIEDRELNDLFSICTAIIDPVNNSIATNQVSENVIGKKIVLSGDFLFGCKSEVENYLTQQGATIQKNVSSKTDIVLVGSLGSNAWVTGNYGTKIKKAMELQAKGSAIAIIKESDFFKG